MPLLIETVLLAVICGTLLPVEATFSTTNASSIGTAILNNYQVTVRPSATVSVSVEFGLVSIGELNNVQQTLTASGLFLMSWQDDRLKWTPSSYGDISSIYLTASQIWMPPVVLANSVDGIAVLSDDSDLASIPLFVTYDGTVKWLAPANCFVSCTVDISYYPFDEQICYVQLAIWQYSISEVILVAVGDDAVSLDQYEENGEWDLTGTSLEFGTRTMHSHTMSQVSFSIDLSRKNSYYIMNLILPVLFISFLGCLVFGLPFESGEKGGYSLTILLSLMVVLSVVSDRIPTTSLNISVLSVYLLTTVMLSSLEVLAVVFLIKIHVQTAYGNTLTERENGWTGSLARILSYKTKEQERNEAQDDGTISITKPKGKIKVTPMESLETVSDNHVQSENSVYYEYEDLANILDKLFFILFFVVTFIMTFIFLMILALGQ